MKKEDPFLQTKTFSLVLIVFLASFGMVTSRDLVLGQNGELIGVVAMALFGLFFGIGILWNERKFYPGVKVFPGDLWQGFCYYVSLLIDLSIPLFFFVWSDRLFYLDLPVLPSLYKFEAVTFLGSLLIFLVYALAFCHGFPRSAREAGSQVFLRVITLFAMWLLNDSLVDALFMYGLVEVSTLSVLMGMYLIAHPYFVKNKKQMKKVFKFDRDMKMIGLYFGLPLILWGLSTCVAGYYGAFIETLPLPSYLSFPIWIVMFVPVFYSHFLALKNYTNDFYNKYK